MLGPARCPDTYYQTALEMARKIKEELLIIALLEGLGGMWCKQGDHMKAERYLQEGLSLAQKAGYRERFIGLLLNSGCVAEARRDYAGAEMHYKESLNLSRSQRHPWLTCKSVIALGRLRLKQRRPRLASSALSKALKLAREIGAQELVAEALYGLARIAGEQCKIAEAKHHGQESWTIFDSIGHGMAPEVKRWLTELSA